ncbi:internalin putative [Algibacter lectus]|uniref:Internalin putative n=1 Tax=Algibacter lectus TaxID=221126 RepID=A0A090VLL5_9FLAO|nr:gliding motility-associated C-terminal domain-containing protein [Algibacter lectus]GAL64219.1 internalin putative [Algibacter lectus]
MAADGSYDSVGEQIAYNITVTNTGNITLTNILITDANADAGSISPANITLLVPGESVSVTATHTLTQTDLDAGTVSNSANVNATDALGNAVSDISDDPNNTADVDANADGDPDDVTVKSITQSPSISLTKAADLAPDGLWDSVGEVITYVLEVANTGNVTLIDIIISDINADAGSISPAIIATLAPGESMMLGANHTITQSDLDTGSVTNTAVVNAKDPKGVLVTDDSDDPNNTTDNDTNGDGEPDDATVTVTPQLAILDVTKAVDFGSYTNIGDVLTYSISVTNAGNVTLLNIILSDTNATFTSGSTVASLAPGETFTANAEHAVTVEDIDAGSVVNTAFVDATIVNSTTSIREDSDDPDNATNADLDNDGDPDDATVSVFGGASDLSIDKVVDQAEPVVNNEVVFTITLTNEGSVTANNIVVEEFIPSGYEFISYIATAGTYSELDGEWTVPVLNEGDIQLLEITVEVLGTGNYLNTATIFSLDGGMDMNTSNNTSTAFVTPQCLEVYNEFSPNSDGDNDFFLISCIENYPNNKLEVYNRWGNIVYQAKGYSNTWDGTSNGRVTINEAKELPVGTYYYVLDLGNGSKPKTGWIYINR